jgi:hypothetical protein
MAFLEKVWAKASGNYEIIVGGWSDESIRFLTGAPTRSIGKGGSAWQTAEQIWDYIISNDNDKYIILVGTPGTTDTATISNGLAANHAYTVLATYIVKA